MRKSLAAGLRAGIVPLIAGVLIAVGVSAGDTSAQDNRARTPAYNQRLCYNPLGTRNGFPDLDRTDISREYLQAVASGCAGVPQRTGMQNAQFHAGQANRIIGEAGSPTALAAAANLFLQVSTSNYASSALQNIARLELARVYRLQRNFAEAERVLRTVTDQSDLGRAVAFERAMVVVSNDTTSGISDDARRVAEAGALTQLSIFAQPESGDRPNLYVRYRGPQELARLASSVGRGAMEPPTLANTQGAVEKFLLAASAVELLPPGGMTVDDIRNNARILVDLGRAQLRLAGHGVGEPDFQCRPGIVSADQLAMPYASFQRATNRDQNLAEGHWGLGCVHMARGETRQAVDEFNRAKALAPNDPQYHLALARAYVSANPPQLDSAIASYNLAGNVQGVHVEIAAAYLGITYPISEREARNLGDKVRTASQANIGPALDHLNTALSSSRDYPTAQDTPNALAYLLRGMVQAHQGGAQNLETAQRNLAAAAFYDRYEAQSWAAEANYQLSLLEQDRGRAGDAVAAADLAVQRAASRTWYRTQACLVRVRFWTSLREGQRASARDYCAVQSKGTPYENAEAYLNQGLYQLRSTFSARGGDQSRAWAAAVEAFRTGVSVLGDPRRLDGNGRTLRAKLARGNNDALACQGNAGVTSLLIDVGGAEDIANATTFFNSYGLADRFGTPVCSARRN